MHRRFTRNSKVFLSRLIFKLSPRKGVMYWWILFMSFCSVSRLSYSENEIFTFLIQNMITFLMLPFNIVFVVSWVLKNLTIHQMGSIYDGQNVFSQLRFMNHLQAVDSRSWLEQLLLSYVFRASFKGIGFNLNPPSPFVCPFLLCLYWRLATIALTISDHKTHHRLSVIVEGATS